MQQTLGTGFLATQFGLPPQRMSFAQDGESLISIDLHDAVVRWNLEPSYWQAQACARVGRNLTAAEWNQYFPGENYSITCDQWPSGDK